MNNKPTPIRGQTLLNNILGRRLLRIVRYILGFPEMNDASGHGITEFYFEGLTISIKPGANEDFIIIDEGAIDEASLNPNYWSKLELSSQGEFAIYVGKKLHRIDLYTDGIEDVALIFRFEGELGLSVVLDDTDLRLTRVFNPLTPLFDGTIPRLRETYQ